MAKSRTALVFVLSGYGVETRGAELMVRELATRLAADHAVAVLGRGTAAPHAVPIRAIARDQRWTRALNRTPGVGHLLRVAQLDPLNWEWLSAMLSAWRWLRRHPCDVLIPEGGRWGGWLGRAWRARTGTPFLDIAHGAPSRWEVAAARQRPDVYVAPTRVGADDMVRRVPGLRTAVIPPGVDRSRFTPQGPRHALELERPVALAVGALEPVKRMDCAIDAVALRERGSLLLIGDGPLADELDARGQSRLGERRFRRVTATPAAMPDWYRSADLLVSPSRSEAFGLVYREAMACGLPIVTQDDPIRREVIGAGGVFCDAGVPAALADAIGAVVARPPVPVAGPDWDEVAEAYRRLIHGLRARRDGV